MASMAINDVLVAHADGDAASLSDAIRCLLYEGDREVASDSACASEEHTIVAQVLQHLLTRPTATLHAVATVLVCTTAEEEEKKAEAAVARMWEVLSGLLAQAKQRQDEAIEGERVEEQAAVAEMLVAYSERIATELTRSTPAPQHLKLLGAWADTVVDMAVRIPVDAATKEAEETEEQGDQEMATPWVVQLVRSFFSVHQRSLTIQTDFRIMTLVWKNLNKLSAVHRTTLLQRGGSDTVEGTVVYSYSAAFEAAAASLARTTQRLWATTSTYADQEIVGELKLLRLFLRAFQGQFMQFVDAMVAQVECSVALAVDAVAAVIPIAEGLLTDSAMTQHEAVRVLQCVMSFVETIARSDKLQASTRSFVGTLLWQSSDKLITLVNQTRSQYVDVDEHTVDARESLLEWGHVLALAAFYAVDGGSHDSSVSSMVSASSPASIEGVAEFSSVATLITRFREWGSRVLIGEFSKSLNVLVDFLLDTLVAQAQSTAALQLFLLEQTLHADPTQRLLLWEIWRELMCFVWEDAVVSTVFNTLLQLTYVKNPKGQVLQADVRDEILGLLAYIYPELCGTVKQEYLGVVSSAFDVVCAEGPNHKFTPQLASSFDLFELLAPTSLLVDYDQPDKEDWIAHHLPVAMECLGGVHDFLDQDQLLRSTERYGVVRVLDAGLLVVRAIFEDNDKAEVQMAHGLGSMLLPMCAETISHLSKLVQRGNGDDGNASLVASRWFTRLLKNCLEILTGLSPLVKRNRSNQCSQVIKDLLAILQSDHELKPHAVVIAIFIRDALGDMWVIPSDADVVWKMLGCVFHKLSALHFGLQVDPATQPLTPPQSVCLEAIYALMVSSNLPEFANRQRTFKTWVVPHAQPRFAMFIQMMCEGAQAAEAIKNVQCNQWCRSDRFIAIHSQRFPSAHTREEDITSRKRERAERTSTIREADGPPPHGSVEYDDDVDMDEAIETAKRIKWDAFAATYWQLHESLSSLSTSVLQEAFLDRLTERDLVQATSALQALLHKNPSK